MSKAFEKKLDDFLDKKTTRPLGAFSVQDVADFFGVTRQAAYLWIRRGTLERESVKPTRITKKNIIDYMSK